MSGGMTPFDMKDSRDTLYSKQRAAHESEGVPHKGGCMLHDSRTHLPLFPCFCPHPLVRLIGEPFLLADVLSSSAYGDNLKNYAMWSSKPEFARQPVIRDTFFRSTGVLRAGGAIKALS